MSLRPRKLVTEPKVWPATTTDLLWIKMKRNTLGWEPLLSKKGVIRETFRMGFLLEGKAEVRDKGSSLECGTKERIVS